MYLHFHTIRGSGDTNRTFASQKYVSRLLEKNSIRKEDIWCLKSVRENEAASGLVQSLMELRALDGVPDARPHLQTELLIPLIKKCSYLLPTVP